MPIQRERATSGEAPQRNVVRTSQTEFNEGLTPSALSPASPVTVPGGSIRVDGPNASSAYAHLLGGAGGLAWKAHDEDIQIAGVLGTGVAGLPSGIEGTALLLSPLELVGDTHGAEVGRKVVLDGHIYKDPVNPSAANDNNQAVVLMQAQIDSTVIPGSITVSVKNSGRDILLYTDDFRVQTPAFTESYLRHLGGPGLLGTTDVSGFLTITHNAGFTPKAVHMIKTDTLGNPNWWQAGTDTYGATTFRARFLDSTGAALNTQAVSGAFICYK